MSPPHGRRRDGGGGRAPCRRDNTADVLSDHATRSNDDADDDANESDSTRRSTSAAVRIVFLKGEVRGEKRRLSDETSFVADDR